MVSYRIGWRLRLMLWIIKTFQKPIHLSDIGLVKKRSNSKFIAYFYDLIKVKVKRVENLLIPSGDFNIPARLYHPKPEQVLPVILYFHGGGFVLGGIEGYDHFCRRLSRMTNCVVISVSYRLAPQFKFPAAHDDALVSLLWVNKQANEYKLDINQFFVAGDSAGGNLAAYLGLEARDRKIAILGLILIYPVLDVSSNEGEHYNFLVSKETSRWFGRNFLTNTEDMSDLRLSIVRQGNFSDLPPILVIKAHYDHLNYEIEAFARKLKAENIAVTSIEFPGTFHGFITMINWSSKSREALSKMNGFIKNCGYI